MLTSVVLLQNMRHDLKPRDTLPILIGEGEPARGGQA
jgi:hypothetical protein